MKFYKKGVKNFELYALAKPQKEKKNRETEDIEYERNCEECTFQPNIIKRKNIKRSKNFIKDVDKAVNRIKNARKEREEINNWKESRTPSSKLIPSIKSKSKMQLKSMKTTTENGVNFFLIFLIKN